MATQARHGAARRGWARRGAAWQGRHGRARQGWAKKCKAGTARRGLARRGPARRGLARQAWPGSARLGEARKGKAGVAGHGVARQGEAGQGRRGPARPGVARRGKAGTEQYPPPEGNQVTGKQRSQINPPNQLSYIVTKTSAPAGHISITAPDFGVLELLITGTAPLVIERFSKKAEIMSKMAQGSVAKGKKERSARDYERDAEEARYRAEDGGWEGANAAAFRAGMISACRLVGFKMTLAKLSAFIEADGFDVADGLPLVRIYGQSQTFTAHTRNATGVVDVRSRPQYRDWAARLRIKFDRAQFSATDMVNLISRVGAQVGIGAGRPDSKASAGCGWGTFRVVGGDEVDSVRAKFSIN